MIHIRPVRPDDAASFLPYLALVAGESPYLLIDEAFIPKTVAEEARLLERIAASSTDFMFVAEDEGQLVGSANLTVTPRERIRHRAEIALSVRKSHWGQGIGRQLLDTLIATARAQGLDSLMLIVRVDNERALRLYRAAGFEIFGTQRRYFRLGDDYYDAHYMALYL